MGYIDETGATVKSPHGFNVAVDFHEGLAGVSIRREDRSTSTKLTDTPSILNLIGAGIFNMGWPQVEHREDSMIPTMQTSYIDKTASTYGNRQTEIAV